MAVDMAGVFLETLVQAVERERLRVNTGRNGHVFITPVFCSVTYPVGVVNLVWWIRKRRHGPPHDFVQTLCLEDYLLGAGMGDTGKAMRQRDIRSDA